MLPKRRHRPRNLACNRRTQAVRRRPEAMVSPRLKLAGSNHLGSEQGGGGQVGRAACGSSQKGCVTTMYPQISNKDVVISLQVHPPDTATRLVGQYLANRKSC